MKITLLFFLLVGSVFSSIAQQNHKKIDYQYNRTENNYVAYTLSVDTVSKQIFFEVVTDWPVKRFSKIAIYHGAHILLEQEVETLPVPNEKDDEKLRVFNFQLERDKLIEQNFDCNLRIEFISKIKKHSVNLPLNYCHIKKYLTK